MSDEINRLQQQIAVLEEKLAFQERAHGQLEDELIKQQAASHRQDRLLSQIMARLKDLRDVVGSDGGAVDDDAPPPHY